MEEWRDVPGWEGMYQVSDQGRVRSLDRVVMQYGKNGSGPHPYFKAGKILSFRYDEHGRQKVVLSGDGKRKDCRVHQLVAISFIGLPPLGMEICHNDGNNQNNSLGNLRYDTHKKNGEDAVRHGTIRRGSKHGASKLEEKDIPKIREMLLSKISMKKIALKFGVCAQTICDISLGRKWTHVP